MSNKLGPLCLSRALVFQSLKLSKRPVQYLPLTLSIPIFTGKIYFRYQNQFFSRLFYKYLTHQTQGQAQSFFIDIWRLYWFAVLGGQNIFAYILVSGSGRVNPFVTESIFRYRTSLESKEPCCQIPHSIKRLELHDKF